MSVLNKYMMYKKIQYITATFDMFVRGKNRFRNKADFLLNFLFDTYLKLEMNILCKRLFFFVGLYMMKSDAFVLYLQACSEFSLYVLEIDILRLMIHLIMQRNRSQQEFLFLNLEKTKQSVICISFNSRIMHSRSAGKTNTQKKYLYVTCSLN